MRMKNKITKIKIIFGLVCLCFFIIISFWFFNVSTNDKTLKIEDEIDLYVTKIKDERGFFLLNDRIVISKNCKEINTTLNSKLTFGHLSKPFRLIKKANSDTLKVEKINTVLYFKFLYPNTPDPEDLTIKEFLQRLFKSDE